MNYLKSSLLLLALALFVACSGDSINYAEKLEGKWELSNVSAILKAGYGGNYDFEALNAGYLKFNANGSYESKIEQLENKGQWGVAQDGSFIQLKADSLPFDDKLKLRFENERSIFIYNNGKEYQFKKLN